MEKLNPRAEKILHYWFGGPEEGSLPESDRTELWLIHDDETQKTITEEFGEDLAKAIAGAYNDWPRSPRGRLALILLLDQFSRRIYRETPQAYAQDEKALKLCLEGVKQDDDQVLTLVERVFYYMPLMHSEALDIQIDSMRAYHSLSELALRETRGLFDGFLAYAAQHYELIQRFGRFPQRNKILHRQSTKDELQFLNQAHLLT